jgi:hypothetical protein
MGYPFPLWHSASRSRRPHRRAWRRLWRRLFNVWAVLVCEAPIGDE